MRKTKNIAKIITTKNYLFNSIIFRIRSVKPNRVEISSSLYLEIELENTPNRREQQKCTFHFDDLHKPLTTAAALTYGRHNAIRFTVN